ncbi:PEP-CTERM sorting domain-containing protein [Tautonia plasticadhaerens]|uniref:PEP-CTERM motif protein n=1 Tax=Tautonia plasticadhaerens TaxID=2527974 RepID=A0A518H7N8_9BACT|nr:PEP-CTERM sorting domain-containing protein [Tautonia plasticadhaerens]QDV36801.1 PEP-CTERM motif protein [Tautonia plasticadhaerens]
MIVPNRARIAGALALCALSFCPDRSADAELITSAAALRSPSTTVGFDPFDFDTPHYLTTSQVVHVDPTPGLGGVTWVPGAADGSALIGNGQLGAVYEPFGFGSNGAWNDVGRGGFTGLVGPDGSMTFEFDAPVSGVGGLINYARPVTGSGPSIAILDVNGSVLESAFLDDPVDGAPVVVGDVLNEGRFRGFQLDSAVIYGFRLSEGRIALDDLAFTRVEIPSAGVVPEPSTLAMAGLGLGVVVAGLRRRRRALA